MVKAWKQLGAAHPGKLGKACLQPYQLAQWLARFARGYLEAREDDSHTSLEWRRDLQMMTTDALRISDRTVSFGLQPRDLVMTLFIDGDIAEEVSAHGVKDAAISAWMHAQLKRLGLDPQALDAPLPYELPPSPYAARAAYNANKDVAALSEIGRYLDNAAMILEDIVAAHGAVTPGPAPLRLWPHHFDLATIITLEEGDFEKARAVGAGLAIPDKLHKDYYFYTYPWPRHERQGLPKLRSNCSYQYDGFFGAVQPMTKIVKAKDQEATVRAFFDETIGVFMGLLEKEIRAGQSAL